jgi:hypothetical protein
MNIKFFEKEIDAIKVINDTLLDSKKEFSRGITYTQTIRAIECMRGYAGSDIVVYENSIYVEFYRDLYFRRTEPRPLSNKEVAELFILVDNFLRDSSKLVKWEPVGVYCSYSLLNYDWDDNTNEIPENLLFVIIKLRGLAYL